MTDFFHSVEFYVLATLVAALIVGFLAKPSLQYRLPLL